MNITQRVYTRADIVKIVLVTVVGGFLFLSAVYYTVSAEVESMKIERQDALVECRRLGGEAILTWDVQHAEFRITGCRVK